MITRDVPMYIYEKLNSKRYSKNICRSFEEGKWKIIDLD